MRAFASVIDEGGFAAAARRMNVSPAAVTRLIAELETHLGSRLINRTTRRIALTESGATYLERVRRILVEVEQAEAEATLSTSDPAGHLRILVPPAFAVHQLAKHLPRFHEAHPRVSIELVVPGPVETVDEAFDVSIIMLATGQLDGDFIAHRLARTEVVLCAAPEYLDRRGRPLSPGELDHHDAMIPPFVRQIDFQQGTLGDDQRPGDLVRLLVSRRPALSTSHIDTMYAAALAGLGIAALPSFVVEDALLEHALERLLPEWQLFSSTLYAAMPTRKHVPARTRAFLDFLIQTFGEPDPQRDPWLLAAGCETRPR